MADLETDYLIVGAGAVGLAFADTLIDEDPDCHITFVDKHAKPGGHWNDAYSFVALHQPSATYGVNSTAFPAEHIEDHGPNKGLYALASGTEVLAYFERVMNARLLPTGRVDYHPSSEYRGRNDAGEARIVSILTGKETTIAVRRKVVDATFFQTSVPSTHTRNFEVADGVEVVPPGELPFLWKRKDDQPRHFVILGAGKTAMDTGVWLLESGIDPAAITWVRPRESWLWNREYTQPGETFFESLAEMQVALFENTAKAADGAELLRLMGEQGYYLRIDPEVEPEMYHYATISPREVEILRRIENVVRKGRVTAIEPGQMRFGEEAVAVPEGALFVDCTATAVPFAARSDHALIFQEDTILLQPLHVPVVTHAAAVTAFIEANFDDDEVRNALASPGPLTDTPATFPYGLMVSMMNRGAWSQNEDIMRFLARSRLDATGPTIARLVADGSPKLAAVQRMREAMQANLPHVIRLGMAAKALHEAELAEGKAA